MENTSSHLIISCALTCLFIIGGTIWRKGWMQFTGLILFIYSLVVLSNTMHERRITENVRTCKVLGKIIDSHCIDDRVKSGKHSYNYYNQCRVALEDGTFLTLPHDMMAMKNEVLSFCENTQLPEDDGYYLNLQPEVLK